LFIKLDKPEKIVKIDELPENGAPSPEVQKILKCTFSK